jgi:predicted amidohydrolase
MKVALISFNPFWENKDSNRLKIVNLLQSIDHQQVDWAIFPEMTLTGFTMNAQVHAENCVDSPSIQFFSECALKYGIYISFGVILKYEDKATNNLLTVSPKGELLANYAKIHPFSYADEDKYYVGGSRLVSTYINDVEVGMSICYDLRFPEIFQALSTSSKIIINIASWPARRVLHWNTLLQARAIENQVFFIGVNRTGTDDDGTDYQKSSAVFSPEGLLLHTQELSLEIDLVELNIAQVDEYQKSFPVKNDRKPGLYKTFYEA